MQTGQATELELAQAQANIYRFLARFFTGAPDESFVDSLLNEAALEAVSDCFSPEVQRELRDLREGRPQPYDINALKQDYWGLFDVPGKRYLAPYESVYRQEGRDRQGRPAGQICGPSTQAVLQAYAEAGMQVSPAFLDLPDHIGVEIGFMAFLYEAEVAVWGDSDPDTAQATRLRQWQTAFLRDHLALWSPLLADRLFAQARTPLYRAAAGMLRCVIPVSSE